MLARFLTLGNLSSPSHWHLVETCNPVPGAGPRTSQNECDGVENNHLAVHLSLGFPEEELGTKIGELSFYLVAIQGKGAREREKEEKSVVS